VTGEPPIRHEEAVDNASACGVCAPCSRGTTGLLLAQLLIHGGAGRVTVAAPTQFKLDLASSYGVDETVRITREPEQTFTTLCDRAPTGFDVTVDVTGASGVVQMLPDLTAVDGTIFVYGMCCCARAGCAPTDPSRTGSGSTTTARP
jgi:D-arabinose 1-dehydrogenase-like Zn-dependent alcohol dehydrogenase